MTSMRRFVWFSQAVVAAVVCYFIYRNVRVHWDDFRQLDLGRTALDLPLLLTGCLVILVTFALLILAWMTLVRGWGNEVGFARAASIWCLSNMGRYVPGKVWAVAGMAVLARRAGIDPLAATGSAVLMQALALGTGVAVVVGMAPGVTPVGAALAVLVVAAASVGALSSRRLLELASRLTGRELRPVSPGALIGAAGATAGAWVGYGFSFWIVLHGVLGDPGITLRAATGYFSASYIMGFVMVFAPGGLGVREGVMVTLLTPSVGATEALVVAVVARLVFTVSELLAVAIVLPFSGSLKGLEQP